MAISANGKRTAGENTSLLPIVQTDISLEDSNRKIIIDTKYYQSALTQNRGSEKLISGNLYQLFAYLSNYKEVTKELSGILISLEIGEKLNLSYEIKGIPIKVYTVDLNRSWDMIHSRLLEIVKE